MWMVEDVKNPARIFKILKEEGYKISVYRGKSEGIKNMHESKISKPISRYGIKCIYQSNWFDGERKKKIREIIRDISSYYEKNAVYCITTHDFSNKNLGNFMFLIKKLKEMQCSNLVKIVNLKQII